MNLKTILAATAILATFSGAANAEMVSLDSNFGSKTVTYNTETGLGWLDLDITDKISYNTLIERLESDADYSYFRLASYAEYEAMINNVFPSLFTATSFYLQRDSSPIVNASEGAYFRSLFGNGSQIIFGKTSDGNTMKWAGSNRWDDGSIGYTDIYSDPNGYSLVSDEVYGNSAQEAGWFLVSTGSADLEAGTFNASDVPVPLMGFAGLGLLALGLRRKSV